MRYFSSEVNEDRHLKDMQDQYFHTGVNEDTHLKDIPGPVTHLITPYN